MSAPWLCRADIVAAIVAAFMLGGGVTAWAAPVDVTTVGVFPNDGLDDSAALTQALQTHEELFFPAGVYDIAR
jgi:hypothetical protein